MSESQRLVEIDICRGIAMLSIVYAHTMGHSEFYSNLRTFDVCLLVFLSGYVSSVKGSIKDFLIKRIVRLVIPVWFFLSIYFLFIFIFNVLGLIDYSFTLGNILGSYSLINGIGYVWVIRVFLIVSILGYFLLKTISSERLIFIIVFILTGFTLLLNSIGLENRIIYLFILEPLPYLAPFMLGAFVKRFTFTKLSALLLLVFSFFCVVSIFLLKSSFFIKYPPSFYYIFYGCGMSLLVFILVRSIFPYFYFLRYISWFGVNSMPLYLWHIPASKYFEKTTLEYTVFYQYIAMIGSGVVLLLVVRGLLTLWDVKMSSNARRWLEG
ncbi:acyltransferase family protein [Vibrio parahaemolyticus]